MSLRFTDRCMVVRSTSRGSANLSRPIAAALLTLATNPAAGGDKIMLR